MIYLLFLGDPTIPNLLSFEMNIITSSLLLIKRKYQRKDQREEGRTKKSTEKNKTIQLNNIPSNLILSLSLLYTTLKQCYYLIIVHHSLSK